MLEFKNELAVVELELQVLPQSSLTLTFLHEYFFFLQEQFQDQISKHEKEHVKSSFQCYLLLLLLLSDC